jgi:hypothetical protein
LRAVAGERADTASKPVCCEHHANCIKGNHNDQTHSPCLRAGFGRRHTGLWQRLGSKVSAKHPDQRIAGEPTERKSCEHPFQTLRSNAKRPDQRIAGEPTERKSCEHPFQTLRSNAKRPDQRIAGEPTERKSCEYPFQTLRSNAKRPDQVIAGEPTERKPAK